MKTVLAVIWVTIASSLFAGHERVSREVFHDEARWSVVNTASKVEACILRVEDPSHGQDLNQRVFVEKRYVALPENLRALVLWKLLDDRNYTWDAVPMCEPTYNARIRFTAGTRTVEVDFCFGCSQMRVRENGVPLGGAYFNPGSDWVFRGLATLFPKDPVIREVKKKREETEIVRLQEEMSQAKQARAEEAKALGQ